MNDPTIPFPIPEGLQATLYPPTSRYHGLEVKIMRDEAGQEIPYLARRWVPAPERFETISEYEVVEGDRTDLVAYQFLNDSEQFWRLCDANVELDPHDLVKPPGKRIRITLPEGVPGAPTDA